MRKSSALAIASSRSAVERERSTSTKPESISRGGSRSRTRNAYPIPVVPGSMPRTVPALGVLKHLDGDVEVRVHLLHVVKVLEAFDEGEHLSRFVALDAHAARGPHADLRGSDRDRRGFDRLLHA